MVQLADATTLSCSEGNERLFRLGVLFLLTQNINLIMKYIYSPFENLKNSSLPFWLNRAFYKRKNSAPLSIIITIKLHLVHPTVVESPSARHSLFSDKFDPSESRLRQEQSKLSNTR